MGDTTQRASRRRQVRYDSLDELAAEIEKLAAGPVRSVGNWNLAQCVNHLTGALEMGLDGVPPAPWPLRWAASLLRKRFLTRTSPAGFKFPKNYAYRLEPGTAEDLAQSVRRFRATLDRWRRESQRHPHPLFGQMTREEWDQLECRHAELHMSFQLPG